MSHDQNWYIGQSHIHGVGIFANRDFPPNSFIDTAIDSNRTITPFGSKLNHSWTPTARLVYDHITRKYDIYTIKGISRNSEITADYTFTPPFIKKPNPQWL